MQTIFHKIYRLVIPQRHPEEIIRQYHIPRALNIQIRLTEEGWFVATIPELPGLVTQARSQQELLEMVNDAVLTYFDVPKREADIVFDKLKIEGMGEVQYEGQLRTA